MVLSTPFAAFGFLAAAGLVALYRFRRRSPPRPVGSLLLWPRTGSASASSSARDRLRLPPSFWIEFIAILALVAAALSPLAVSRQAGALHVILDRSPSMSAGGASGLADAFLARERAERADGAVSVREVSDSRALARALTAAVASLPHGDEILVLTDAPPDFDLPPAGVRWESFGDPLPNTAIVAARRRRAEPGRDRVFVAIRRFGAADAQGGGIDVPWSAGPGVSGRALAVPDGDGRARASFDVPASAPQVAVSIAGDAFAADDSVVLAPPDVPALSARLDIGNDALRELVVRALDATGFVARYAAEGEDADLTVSDGADRPHGGYLLAFAPASKTLSSARVWCDPAHPLLDGVSFDGAWTAAGDGPIPGIPLAVAAGRTLVSATPDSCHVAFDDPRLPFFRSPSFPSLVQNVASMAAELSGGREAAAARRRETEAGNLLDAGESDLTARRRASLGARAENPGSVAAGRAVAWMPALVAVAALLLHIALYRRRAMFAPLAVALLALAGPVVPLRGDAGLVVAVVDRSASLGPDALAEQERLVAALSDARPHGARLAVVSFGADCAVERAPAAAPFGRFEREVDADGSDLGAALSRAESLAEPGDGARFLVISDGLVTGDDARALTHPVDACVVSRPVADDLAVSRLDAPATASPGSAIPVTAWVESPSVSTNDYVMLAGTNVLSRGRAVFRAGLTPLAFRDVARATGVVRYTLDIAPSESDPRPGNNRASVLVEVAGRRPLLWLRSGSGPSRGAEIARRAGVDVRTASAADFQPSLASLRDYAGVVLEDVPAASFPPAFMRGLAAYVTDLGGGLAMTGGDSSFGPGGWCRTPVEDVLPVSLELRDERRKFAVSLAIVLDRSGSMAATVAGGRTKMDMANLGAVGAMEMLTGADEVAVFAVDSSPHRVIALTDGADAMSRSEKVLRIDPGGGGIFVEEGVMAALRELERASNPNRHVILFADASDAEEPGDYGRYLAKAAEAGVTLSVIALGTPGDVDARLLKDIARVGRGECYFESDASEIPRLFRQDTYLSLKTAMVTNRTPVAATAAVKGLSDSFCPDAASSFVGGYDLVYLRPDADCAIRTLDGEDAPILAYRRAGLGRALAYAGEIDGARADPLMESRHGAELVAAIARWTRGDGDGEGGGFFVERALVPGGVRVTAVSDGDAGGASNAGLPLVIVRESPSRGTVRERATLEREDDDVFSATVPLRGDETLYAAVATGDGAPVALPPVRLPYGAEARPVRDPREGERRLKRLAELTGGVVRASPAGIWGETASGPRRLPLGWIMYLAAAFLVLAAVAARALGWFAAAARLVIPKIRSVRRSRAKGPSAPTTPTAASAPAAPTPEPSAAPTTATLDAIKAAGRASRARLG